MENYLGRELDTLYMHGARLKFSGRNSSSRGSSEEELVEFTLPWHRLSPWPDTVAGFKTELRMKYVIASLS